MAEGLARYEVEVCPGCNIHPTVVDQLGTLTFDDKLCKICKAQAGYGRVLHERDRAWDEAHKDAPAQKPRPSDGRYTRMRPATPEELAERETRHRR